MTGDGFSNDSHINQSYLEIQPQSCLLEESDDAIRAQFGQRESHHSDSKTIGH
jgi:hypothetical protein